MELDHSNFAWSGLNICFLYTYSDINECLINNGGCHHNCSGSDGNYTCSCNNGYRLNSDGHTCEGRQKLMSRNLLRCMYSTPVQLWVMKYWKVYYRYSELWKTSSILAVGIWMHFLLSGYAGNGLYSASKSICFQIKVYSSICNHVLQLFGKIGCTLSTFCVLVFLSFTYECNHTPRCS